MTKIHIKAEHTILMKEHPQKDVVVPLDLTIAKEKQAKVVLSLDDKSLVVEIANCLISERLLFSLLQDQTNRLDSFPPELKEEIRQIHSTCSTISQMVLSYIKYHLVYTDISEQLFTIKSKRWKVDGQDWRPIPSSFSIVVDGRNIPRFDKCTCSNLQESLDEEFEPLLAMRHLHRAKNELIPHHKWIDATIAAELAIKEVLIQAKPDLEALLLEVTSPPLTKLYGSVL